jgi:hypothetical protein
MFQLPVRLPGRANSGFQAQTLEIFETIEFQVFS